MRITGVHRLAEDLVLIDATQTIDGLPDRARSEAIVIAVAKKSADGSWKLASVRPYVKANPSVTAAEK